MKWVFPSKISVTMQDNEFGKIIRVSELIPKNTIVASLILNDEDSGINGEIKIEIKQFKLRVCQDSNKEILDESSDFQVISKKYTDDSNDLVFTFITKQYLDRELHSKYIFHINLSDGGNPPLKKFTTLEIFLIDENDFIPKFNLDLYEFNLSPIKTDNFNEWIVTGKVTAYDIDLNEYQKISYELTMINEELCKLLI